MRAPLAGPLRVTQLFGSLRGGAREAYTAAHDGASYVCVGHCGIDFDCPLGTPVLAMKSGVLSVTPHDPWFGGYAAALGLYAVITLPTGERHVYAHLSDVTAASGHLVPSGVPFALSGDSGNSSGPHLHVTLRPARPDYGNGFDGGEDFLTHFDHDVFARLDLQLV